MGRRQSDDLPAPFRLDLNTIFQWAALAVNEAPRRSIWPSSTAGPTSLSSLCLLDPLVRRVWQLGDALT